MFLDVFIDLISYVLRSDYFNYFFLPVFCLGLIIVFSQIVMSLVRWLR